jgi:hypothetical protein
MPSVSIEDFRSSVAPSKVNQKLEFALQSFAKRSKYSEFYYYNFIECASDGKLALERIDSSGNLRLSFEAFATAFVANAHAIIDSFPYVVFLTLKPLKFPHSLTSLPTNITAGSSNWSNDFYNSILHTYPKEKKFAILLKSIMDDKDFLLLRKMSNNHKHKFLSRIINNRKVLKYEIIDFDSGKVSRTDVRLFFKRLHNSLLPKLFNLYNNLARVSDKYR